MNWQDLGKQIAKTAPLLGTAIAGVPGTAIGALIAQVFGGNPDDPNELLKKINGDPDKEVKLKKLELENNPELQRIALELTKAKLQDEQNKRELEFNDVKGARQRETELAKVGQRDLTTQVIAFLIVFGFFLLIGAIMFTRQDNSDRDILNILVGVLGTGFVQVLNYYFGTSISSRNRDAILLTQTKELA